MLFAASDWSDDDDSGGGDDDGSGGGGDDNDNDDDNDGDDDDDDDAPSPVEVVANERASTEAPPHLHRTFPTLRAAAAACCLRQDLIIFRLDLTSPACCGAALARACFCLRPSVRPSRFLPGRPASAAKLQSFCRPPSPPPPPPPQPACLTMSTSLHDIGTVMGAAHLLGTSKKVTERRNGCRDLAEALGDTDVVRDIHETDALNRGLLHHQLAPRSAGGQAADAVVNASKTLTWSRLVRYAAQGVEVEMSAGKLACTT